MRVGFVCVALALAGCGSSDDSGGSSTPATPPLQAGWTTDLILGVRANCAVAAKQANSSISDAAATTVCACTIEDADHRWTYADYVANESRYTDQQNADGTIAKCSAKAKGL